MLEIPEAYTIASQLNNTVAGKIISRVIVGHSPHKFAWFSGESEEYENMLNGKTINKAVCYGGRPELHIDGIILSFNDGVNIRYFDEKSKRPEKHQLLLEFTDGSAIICTVQMYGGMFCFIERTNDDFYYRVAVEKPSPLCNGFDMNYFLSLLNEETKKLSAKAFLATQQRIPGLGNGVLQDILWKAKIHPKRKMNTLSEHEYEEMFNSVKSVLSKMSELRGRDSEKDLYGSAGGYITVMSKKNDSMPCPVCGDTIKRMAYLGGNVYVCNTCQKEIK